MATNPNDPLVPINHDELDALVRVRRITAKELARRAGVSDTAVLYLLKDRPGGGRTQRVHRSTAEKIAVALGLSFDAETGSFFIPVEVLDVDGYRTARQPAIYAVIDSDADRFCDILRIDEPADRMTIHWLLDLNLWARRHALDNSLPVRGEWSEGWTRLAEIAAVCAVPASSKALGQALVDLARKLGDHGGVFWQNVHGDDAEKD